MTNRLIEKAQVKDARRCRPKRQPPSLQSFMDCKEFADQPPHDLQKKYLLQLTTISEFWANNAEYSRAKKIAEKCMLDHIYGDIRSMIHRLRLEVHNGNTEEAMRLLHNMEELMNR